ncbi:MAG: DnaD domain protein [Lachnospiraceae bacterium]|nr:DnaD domain protein [Lachnospiraceae bacterium]
MSQVTLYGDCVSGATILSNRFIDIYMGNANDAQIKIYLYLLRCIGGNMPVSVSIIADFFNYTEKDVLRALKYWEKQRLLKLTFSDSKQLTEIQLLPIQAIASTTQTALQAVTVEPAAAERTEAKVFRLPEKPNYSAEKLLDFRNRPDIAQFLFVAEQYMKKTLNANEVSSFLYMYDALGFDTDLLEYLVEYCANNKKKSIRYIESVANSWAASGIRYVEEAKEYTANVPTEIYDVFKAFGIRTNRTPLETELIYVRRWKSLGFSTELMIEACTRTVMSTHNPSFAYADKILSNWNNENVRNLSDVERLDQEHMQNVRPIEKTAKENPEKPQTANKFKNFSQRTYDYSALEKEAFQ